MVKHERSPTDGYWATGSQSRLQRWTAQRRLSLASSQPTPKRARHSLPTTQQSSVRRPRHSQPDPYSHSLARARPYPRDLVPSVIRRPSPEPEPEPEQLPEVNPGPRSSERYAGERIDIFNLAGYHIASIPLKVLEHHPGGARWEHVLELLERITASKAAKQDPLRPRRAGGTCPPFMNADGSEYVFAGGTLHDSSLRMAGQDKLTTRGKRTKDDRVAPRAASAVLRRGRRSRKSCMRGS